MSHQIMTSDEYHEHPALGSTSIKRALIHPALVYAPSTIDPRVAAEGTRLHTAVIEPDMMHQRYQVAPDPEDYPNALRTASDMRDALKAAGVKGYSGKKSDELAAMVRESIPNALLWSDVLSRQAREGAGKMFVSADEWDQMERTAEAVLSHPVIQGEGIFADGIGEASFFCEIEYQTPGLFGRDWSLKARPDWLQMTRRVADLKSWRGGRDVEAFYRHASDLHYDLSAALYLDVLAEHGHGSSTFTWVVVDKSTLHAGGHVVVHVATLDFAFLEQGREKLSCALERIADWQSSPERFDRCNLIEHIATPPRWGWRRP